VGWSVLGFGVLVLLFVAYQLWGTGLYTSIHQAQLRTQFDHELGLVHRHRSTPATTTASPATTTTTLNGVVQPVPGDVPAEGQPIGTIDIPAIGANYVVVQGVSTDDLELGPGHYPGTPLPGQPGNAAIAGHRTTYLHPFYNLDQLQPGDPIYITTLQGRFEYEVQTTLVVDPSDTSVLDPTPVPELTLTTCNPRYSAAQRLVVHAVLVSPPPIKEVESSPTAPLEKDVAAPIARGSVKSTGGPTTASLLGASVGWGLGCIVTALGIWFALRRRSWRLARWGVASLGSLAFLVLLFFFFGSLSPLLPASF
jgi:sortase A